MTVTADTTLWTADTLCVTADGRVICIDAVVAEPVGGHGPTADTTLYTADNTVLTADGGAVAGATDSLDAVVQVAGAIIPVDVVEAAAALDQLDAAVIPEIVAAPGGAHYPRRRPLPIYGIGYGVLPQLWGEAHGVVGVVGAGAGTLPGLTGEAAGAAGVAGRSAADLKGLAVAGKGAIGTRGTGAGVIVKFSGAATGQHDDDEAAVIAFLLAA